MPKPKYITLPEQVLAELSEASQIIRTAMRSCREGQDGTWDVATPEGREGFQDIRDELERANMLVVSGAAYVRLCALFHEHIRTHLDLASSALAKVTDPMKKDNP